MKVSWADVSHTEAPLSFRLLWRGRDQPSTHRDLEVRADSALHSNSRRGHQRLSAAICSWNLRGSRVGLLAPRPPRGGQLVALEDAGNYITKLPKAEHEAVEWLARRHLSSAG